MKKSMKLLGHKIEIVTEDPTRWAPGGLGRSNIATGRILLNSELPETMQLSTLLHETIHMVLDYQGLPEHSRNEALVCAMESGLFSWMRDNPALVMEMSGVSIPRGQPKSLTSNPPSGTFKRV